ncbi:LPKTxAVK-anchored surface protein [Streptococcus sp. IMAU 99161]|uniref:LPKTxAVK-anchored surface protein n=1 Tax=Streptococcus sp. IMAU 99161 TaxID=2710601 RepID=UPI001655B4B3|nr:LPKTxAVK-anchored surface protein [Streptococcus sp. IMAU 99161]MBC8775712.1 hypothetical protein [Streptococcus sp. IMAU 99161]
MKKVLLSSVAALAVFAAATPVFANNTGQHYSADDNATPLTGADMFTNDKDGLTQYNKDGLNNVDADSTKAKFNENGEKLVPVPGKPGEFVVEGASKDAKADAKKADDKKADAKAPAAAAGQKALPKTSAVK